MLKIENRKIGNKEVVFINEQESNKAVYQYGRLNLEKTFEDFEFVNSHSFNELRDANLKAVRGSKGKEKNNSILYIDLNVITQGVNKRKPNSKNENRIEIGLIFHYDEWKKQYSINEFTEILDARLRKDKFINLNNNIFLNERPTWLTLSLYDIAIKNLQDTDVPKKYIDEALEVLEPLIVEVVEELDKKIQLDVYTTYFNFPSELKIACNQYLMYFAQFLLDLGIESQTKLKDTPEGTFFSVTPQNKTEAIGNIRKLLTEFMNAPGYDEFETEIESYSDISAIQWHANILHLKSQIAFATTQMQMKDAIIQMKDAALNSLYLTNYQLSEKIETAAKKGEEQIIPGILSVTKIERFGGKLNLAELLRRLKRIF